MPKLKSRRKLRWPGGWKRQPAYKHLHQLHRYEEQAVLALLVERGSGSAAEWSATEPGRWNPRYLELVFRRLHAKGLTRRSGLVSVFWRGRRYTYEPKERAA